MLASWFVAQTKLEYSQNLMGASDLLEQLGVDRLPPLSMANVRTLLRAVMPLPQLTPEEATRQVAAHLFNRVQSRKSRLKNGKKPPA